jgi:hypothetical protein
MNRSIARRIGIAALVVAVAGVLCWHHWRPAERATEGAALPDQTEFGEEDPASTRTVLADQTPPSNPSHDDLNSVARLRAQTDRVRALEDEKARLASEQESPAGAAEGATPEPEVPDEETPEWDVELSAMNLCRHLAFAAIAYPDFNDGELPSDLPTAMDMLVALKGDAFDELFVDLKMPPEYAFDLIRNVEFEMVSQGRLDDLAQDHLRPWNVAMVRQVEPLQLSNGRWARAFAIHNRSSTTSFTILTAASLDELAEIEDRVLRMLATTM